MAHCIKDLYFFLSLSVVFLGWHTFPLHASAEACLTGWPNAQPQGRDYTVFQEKFTPMSVK